MKDIITAENISKAYRIGVRDKKADTLLGAVWQGVKSPVKNFRQLKSLRNLNGHDDSIFWALRDISFSVKEGEVLGIIGHNGAGKSTLLKILSRITDPTSGRIVIRGRVSSLLEVGTGFHPDLTGRENIYMNGTILGMRKREIDAKFDEIIEFSGIEKHIDTPVKRYSSGMTVRLAFSVAAHLEPEILIIDEVLAVGDAEFQNKCLGKMNDVAQAGRTVLFVSHNMAAVRSLCTNSLLLGSGAIQYQGTPDKAIDQYLVHRPSSHDSLASNGFKLEKFEISFDGSVLKTGGSLKVKGLVRGICSDQVPYIVLSINSIIGERIVLLSSRLQRISIPAFDEYMDFGVRVSNLNLMPNRYSVSVRILTLTGKAIAEWLNVSEFNVDCNDVLGRLTLPSSRDRGIVYCDSEWNVSAE